MWQLQSLNSYDITYHDYNTNKTINMQIQDIKNAIDTIPVKTLCQLVLKVNSDKYRQLNLSEEHYVDIYPFLDKHISEITPELVKSCKNQLCTILMDQEYKENINVYKYFSANLTKFIDREIVLITLGNKQFELLIDDVNNIIDNLPKKIIGDLVMYFYEKYKSGTISIMPYYDTFSFFQTFNSNNVLFEDPNLEDDDTLYYFQQILKQIIYTRAFENQDIYIFFTYKLGPFVEKFLQNNNGTVTEDIILNSNHKQFFIPIIPLNCSYYLINKSTNLGICLNETQIEDFKRTVLLNLQNQETNFDNKLLNLNVLNVDAQLDYLLKNYIKLNIEDQNELFNLLMKFNIGNIYNFFGINHPDRPNTIFIDHIGINTVINKLLSNVNYVGHLLDLIGGISENNKNILILSNNDNYEILIHEQIRESLICLLRNYYQLSYDEQLKIFALFVHLWPETYTNIPDINKIEPVSPLINNNTNLTIICNSNQNLIPPTRFMQNILTILENTNIPTITSSIGNNDTFNNVFDNDNFHENMYYNTEFQKLFDNNNDNAARAAFLKNTNNDLLFMHPYNSELIVYLTQEQLTDIKQNILYNNIEYKNALISQYLCEKTNGIINDLYFFRALPVDIQQLFNQNYFDVVELTNDDLLSKLLNEPYNKFSEKMKCLYFAMIDETINQDNHKNLMYLEENLEADLKILKALIIDDGFKTEPFNQTLIEYTNKTQEFYERQEK